MSNEQLSFLHPYFLGAYAENDHVFERTLLECFREHAYWRRNFHPENRPPIPPTAFYREDYNEFLAAMQQELHTLSADLKKSVPFFSPRYLGHMAADLLIPGLLAQIMTTLYNPNNVSDDAAPATVEKELEVGFMLARMFGFNTDNAAIPCAWGHLTSGGTLANYEGLWHLRAVKHYPISLATALAAHNIATPPMGYLQKPLADYTPWELFNFSIRETCVLMHTMLGWSRQNLDPIAFRALTKSIMAESLESLGMAGFFLKHRTVKPPVVIIPTTAHYSWQKAMKVLGLGTAQLQYVPTDAHMRMRIDKLEQQLMQNLTDQQPVLAVIGVLGSTEFGSVDPIHRIVGMRQAWGEKGLYFGIHVDAAWGGYMTSIFRNPDGTFVDHEEIANTFKYFPHRDTWEAFRAVSQTDSVTVDPHKLGYLPFPSGAFISRDAGVLDFIHQKAAYVFDVKDNRPKQNVRQKLLSLGQYIMEGSKPGSAAAAAYVTHRVLPLHKDGFGRILKQSMKACEYFFDKIADVKKRLGNIITITVPFSPDTNLICYVINPRHNRNLALMNHFSRKIFERMKIDATQPLQSHHFFGSFTSLNKQQLDAEQAARILDELGIDQNSFRENVDEPTKQADHIFVIRHTLMNPWLMHEENGLNYIDRYILFLERCVVESMARAIEASKEKEACKEKEATSRRK